jgi:membrane protease YdiL (CAAX protease family)
VARNVPGSVTTFYVLALGLSWAGWIPFAAAQAGILPIRVPFDVPILTQFGPTVAAFLLVARADGLSGLRRFLARSCRWNVGIGWYLTALLLTPAIAVVWQLVHRALGADVPGWSDLAGIYPAYVEAFGGGGPYALEQALPSAGPIGFLQQLVARGPIWALANFLLFAIATGPISEEFGWRGYALPRLQVERTALRAAVSVGILWGFWHTGPDFWRMLFEGDARAFLYPLAMTMGTVPLSIMFAWMFNQTGGSLLPPMLFHASFNSTLYVLTLIWVDHPAILTGGELVVGLWIAAAVVVVRNGAATLTRHATVVRP